MCTTINKEKRKEREKIRRNLSKELESKARQLRGRNNKYDIQKGELRSESFASKAEDLRQASISLICQVKPNCRSVQDKMFDRNQKVKKYYYYLRRMKYKTFGIEFLIFKILFKMKVVKIN